MNSPRIAITGIGLVSSLGWTLDGTWGAIESGRSGLGSLTLFTVARSNGAPVGQVLGDVKAHSPLGYGSRTDHLAAHAASAALSDAGLERQPGTERPATGLVLGVTTGGILDSEEFLEDILRGQPPDFERLRHHECAAVTHAVAGMLGLGGFRATVSTACSSGAVALAMARDVLLAGKAETMLAGGVDSLTRLTMNGFLSLLAVAPDGCRPFDAERAGMSLGEGAAVLVLETEERAWRRGARIRAFLAGTGSSCDAYHATAPAPDGEGMARAMCRAIEDAAVDRANIQYINAHGTATIDNDINEARAILHVFGPEPPAVSSTKRFFGHTLAAAGAIEAAVCVMALEHQCVPANLGLRHCDPGIGFLPVTETHAAALQMVMSNSMGFGGNNCSLIFSHAESPSS
jgi:3-oxoacyl-[acyl-carrier-protein] synthase II